MSVPSLTPIPSHPVQGRVHFSRLLTLVHAQLGGSSITILAALLLGPDSGFIVQFQLVIIRMEGRILPVRPKSTVSPPLQPQTGQKNNLCGDIRFPMHIAADRGFQIPVDKVRRTIGPRYSV